MKLNRTENHIMFDCQVDILNGLPTGTTRATVFAFINDYYINEGVEINNNFSHDNWKMVACWLKTFYPKELKKLPLWDRNLARPDNFCLFLYIKNRFIGYPFLLIYSLFQIIDLIRMRKDGAGRPHTSGILLNYFVFRAFKFKWMAKFLDWRVANTFKGQYHPDSKGGWDEIFRIYYNQGHNIRVLEAFWEQNELA